MKAATVIIVAAAALLLVHRCTTPAATLRFRITVQADTPAGSQSGSSVVELVLNRKFLIGMPGAGGADYGQRWNVFGEMPVIDLGDGTTLFTLVHDKEYRPEHGIDSIVLDGIRLQERRRSTGGPSDEAIVRELNISRPSADVANPRHWPALALFSDEQNPDTMTEILPARVGEAPTKPYAVRRVTVSVVGRDESLTTTLAMRFPKLAA